MVTTCRDDGEFICWGSSSSRGTFVTTQLVLTCGSCRTSHQLTGDATVVAAEIATFMAVHRDHNEFRIQTGTTGNEVDAAD